jgi:hypothetical protein
VFEGGFDRPWCFAKIFERFLVFCGEILLALVFCGEILLDLVFVVRSNQLLVVLFWVSVSP